MKWSFARLGVLVMACAIPLVLVFSPGQDGLIIAAELVVLLLLVGLPQIRWNLVWEVIDRASAFRMFAYARNVNQLARQREMRTTHEAPELDQLCCLRCQTSVQLGARFCHTCGNALGNQYKLCYRCDSVMVVEAQFCPLCRFPMGDGSEAPRTSGRATRELSLHELLSPQAEAQAELLRETAWVNAPGNDPLTPDDEHALRAQDIWGALLPDTCEETQKRRRATTSLSRSEGPSTVF